MRSLANTTPLTRMKIAGAISAVLLLTAFGFQYIGGLQPCPLCTLQRWPHAIAMAITGLLFLPLATPRNSMLLGALATLALFLGSIVALIHTGVELGVWNSPLPACAMGALEGSASEAMARIEAGPPIDCSVVPWSFLGHSMAGWNLFFTAMLTGIWAGATWRLTSSEKEIVS